MKIAASMCDNVFNGLSKGLDKFMVEHLSLMFKDTC